MLKIISVTLLVFVTTLLNAQNYSVHKLSKVDGLSNSSVVSIAQDKSGHLWIATEDGLNRFDGNGFETFYKSYSNTKSLSGNELNCILDDPEDSVIWIATQRADINTYNYKTDEFKSYAMPRSATHIAPSSDKSIWISTYWDGIFYFDKSKNYFKSYNEQNVENWIKGNIWTIQEDFSTGIVYIGYSNKGLSSFDKKSGEYKNYVNNPDDKNSLPDNEVLSIFIDNNNKVWVGTRTGLALFNKENGTFTRFDKPQGAVFDIKMLNNNQLWIALELGGIVVLNVNNPEQYFVIEEGNSSKGLSGNSVRCILPDKYGNIWAGIWNGGLNFINNDGEIFDTYSDKSVLSVTSDNEGRLWLGTDGEGICVIDKNNQTKTYNNQNSNIPSLFVQTAFKDSAQNLWFGFYKKGAAVYDPKKQQFYNPLPEKYNDIDVRGGCLFDKDNLLLATNLGILKVSTNNKSTQLIELPHGDVRSILRDCYGNIWAGTFGGGLFILNDKFEVISSFDYQDGFPSNTVNHIAEDSQQKIWVATAEGLVCFDNRRNFKFRVFRKEDGLFNAHIRAIAEDADKNIWISTNNGISCYLYGKGTFKNFSPHYNIPSGEFSSGAVTKSGNGELVFASIKGVCKFLPQNVLNDKDPPDALIGNIRIFLPPNSERLDNERIISAFTNEGIVLKHYENNFTLSFFTANYANSNMIEYALKLEGSGKDFYTALDPQNVFFLNIPPGQYTLKVKTRFVDRSYSNKITSLKITILPPWYLTWFAKLLYILTAGAIIYFLLRAYKHRVNMQAELKTEKQTREKQEALNEERMKFYTNAAHEIRTPLSLIAGPLEDLAEDKTLNEATSKKINLINRNSRKLLLLVNNLLDLRKTETSKFKLKITRGFFDQIVESQVNNYRELNRNQDIEIIYQRQETDYEMFFDSQCANTIISNIIYNALKYTTKGYIKITLNKIKETAVVSVTDTGYGISKEALPKIFDRYYQERGPNRATGTGIGLALVKNLVDLHKGEIKVESQKGQGTTFTVSIPSLPDIAEPEDKTAETASKKADKPIVLFVEDNDDITEYVKMSLNDKYTVITASDGEQGITSAFDKTPEIVISDIMMPKKDGIELCSTLKNDLRTSHIPIILLTAKDSLEDKTRGYESGADSYITKPFNASLLKSRIENLLEKKRKLAGYYLAHATSQKFIEGLSTTDAEFMKKINSIIEENLDNTEFSVALVSKTMCISTSTLYRKIKALTLVSLNEYIKKYRIRKAAALLGEGRYTINETVFKVGFGSADYFRDCFKEEYGISPSEYIKRIKTGA